MIESAGLRAVMTIEGANIAAIEHRATGINPLWTPPWHPVEPSLYSPATHPEYGSHDEAKVLASIQGHNICLDTYGSPSPAEASAGIPIHGEAMFVSYEPAQEGDEISLTGILPLAQLRWKRRIRPAGSNAIRIVESVENLTSSDRPIAWTQHVTIGPPFLEPGHTRFAATVTRSKVIDADFGGAQKRAAEFEWPHCPRSGGGSIDLRVYPDERPSGGYTTHLVDPSRTNGYWIAWSPSSRVYFGYVWNREDFPWMCRWEENHLRSIPPWNSRTVTCGMEFGVSPTVASRRDMVSRASLFGVPSYRWLPAKSELSAAYATFIGQADEIPSSVEWDGADQVVVVN